MSGRLAAFKMLHLPLILYLFRTLPIPIPNFFFRSLQTLLNKCIWQGSKPRCAHSTLIKHKSAGGSGTIDFRDYYTALLLDQLTEWFQPCPTKLWCIIENLSLIHPNVKWWVMSTPFRTRLSSALSPTMLASASAWKTLIQESTKHANTPSGNSPSFIA